MPRWGLAAKRGQARLPILEGSLTMLATAPMLWMLMMASAAAAPAPPTQVAQPRTMDPALPGTADGTEREPEAIAALEKMGGYLRTLTTFAVEGTGSTEESLTTGQKIMYPGTIDLLATRPNR